MQRFAKLLMKAILPLLLLAGGWAVAQYLMATGPEPAKLPPVDRTPVVEVMEISPQDYTVPVKAAGVVRARTQTNLVAEVGGKAMEISPNFRPGGYFAKGDLLLALDGTNYLDSIQIAKSNIAANEASLAQLDQEETNTRNNLQLAEKNLLTVQKNLQLAQQNLTNVKRKDTPIQKNTGLIQQNQAITRKNLELSKRNLELGKRNLALAQKELQRTEDLANRRLIPLNQVETQQQKVLQLQQANTQLEQSILQQQQNAVQQEQQLSQQDQSLAQQDQNVLSQQQQILQQEQAVNQQLQTVTNLRGQLAMFDSRRNAVQANNQLIRTQLLQQERNLERTKITAPYSGRILEQKVDVGQYVSQNAVIGVMYATDYVEVELPLTLEQFALLDMPDSFSHDPANPDTLPAVEFTLPFGQGKQGWKGQITGTRASLDAQSRQITVVARIDNPFERQDGQDTTLKIGQYLNANITGRTFKQIYLVPTSTVRQNRDILLMQENKVHIAPIEVVWSGEQDSVITLAAGENTAAPLKLITTALGQASEGMTVALPGQKKKPGRGKPQADQGNAGNGQNPSLRDVPAGEQPTGGKPQGEGRRGKPAEGQTSEGQTPVPPSPPKPQGE